jgi:hypothetical protein
MLGRDVRHSFVFYYGGKTKKASSKKKSRSVFGESEGEKRALYRRECAGGHKSRERERTKRDDDEKQKKISK